MKNLGNDSYRQILKCFCFPECIKLGHASDQQSSCCGKLGTNIYLLQRTSFFKYLKQATVELLIAYAQGQVYFRSENMIPFSESGIHICSLRLQVYTLYHIACSGI